MAGADNSGKLVEAIVAAGRTVVDATGAEVRGGKTATLSRADAKRLRGLGYLTDGTAAASAPPVGPHIAASDGPTVRLA